MSDELEFPLDQCINLESYVSYCKRYAVVKNYVEQEWSRLVPSDSTPIPKKTAKIKWLIRHGIPMHLRCRLWYEYSGAAIEQQTAPELFSLLYWKELQDKQLGYSSDNNKVLAFVEMIDQDRGLSSSLRKVLVAFAYYSFPHPDKSRKPIRTCTYQIGYCQSLNFIVAFLLLVFSKSIGDDPSQSSIEEIEEKVFWMLIIIVEKLMPTKMYGSDIKGARTQQQILWDWIIREHGESFGLEKLSKWLKEIDQRLDPFLSITTGWFMNLFITVFPNDTTLRILDSLFYQGEKTLYRAAVGFFQINQDNIIGFHDWFDACKYIKNAPKKMINAHSLLEKMYKKFNPVELEDGSPEEESKNLWIGLDPIEFSNERKESLETIQFTRTSHLSKHVILHARHCLQRSASASALSKMSIAIDSHITSFFYNN